MATAYPIILALLNVDSSTYYYSTDDWVQTNTTPDRRFDPVLEDAPTIQQQLRDLYFGVEDSTSVSLDFLPITSPQDSNWAEITSKHDLRNGKISLWLIDGDADPAVGANYIFQYYGNIVGWTWKDNGGIHVTIEGRSDAVFDTPLPSKLVNTDDYDSTALDIGMPIPMPFGYCKNVICPNICNDLPNDYYDYAVAYSTDDIEGIWEVAGERGVRRDGILSTTTDYTFFNVSTVGNPYANTAFIRFSLEQLDGHYLEITADVKGPLHGGATATRDFTYVLETILSDATVGLGLSVDSLTFLDAQTALGNIGSMYCDGVLQEQWQARDYIDQMLRVMRGSLQRGSDGEWELTIDQTGSSVQTFGDNDGLYNNCNFEYREPVNADSAVKKITLKYDLGIGGKTIEQSVRTGFGSPLDLELQFVANDDTATKVLSYEYQNSLLGDEEVGLTVEHYEGGDINLGDVITLVGGDSDYITNGDAELGATTGWTKYANSGTGAAATLTADSTTAVRLEGDYSFKVAVTGAGTAITDISIYQSIDDFEVGELYRIEFWSMASEASKTLRYYTAKTTTPYTPLSNTPTYKEVTLGTSWQRFVWEFRPSYTYTGDQRFALMFGGQGTFNVWFDKISIRKVTQPNIGINEQTYRVINVSRNNVDQFNLVGRRYFEVLHDDIAVTPPTTETPSSKVVKGPRAIHGAVTLGDGENVAGTITMSLAPDKGDVYIAAGKTNFDNTQTGFILGIDDSDSDKAKFYIGSSAQYLNWNGSVLTVQGAITATSGSLSTLTVTGSITISSGGYIASGKTSYADTTAGFYLGNDGGTPKFKIGGTQYLSWDGSTLTVSGNFTVGNPSSVRNDLTVESATSSVNLVANPGFEEGDRLWQKSNAVITTEDSYRGSYCAKIDGTLGTGYIVSLKTFGTSVGERYLLNAYIKAAAGTNGSVLVMIQFYTSGSVWISNNTVGGTTVPGTTYEWRRGIVTAPANAAFAKIGVILQTPTAGMLYVDEILCGVVPKDADINALSTTNGPAEALADVTGSHTSANTSKVNGSTNDAGSFFTVNGSISVTGNITFSSAGDLFFYDGITKICEMYSSTGAFTHNVYGNYSCIASGSVDIWSGGVSGPRITMGTGTNLILKNSTFTVTISTTSCAVSGTISAANHYLSGTSGNFGVSGGARLYVATSQATLYSSSTHYVTNIGTTFRPSDQGSDGTGTDLGNPSYYWEQLYCYHLNYVADLFFLDYWKDPTTGEIELVDDVEIVKAIKGSGVFDPNLGLELIDDSTLHPAIISRYGKDTFDIDIDTGEPYQLGTAGEVIQDPTGKPFLSHTTMISLLMGCIRKLDERLAKLEN